MLHLLDIDEIVVRGPDAWTRSALLGRRFRLRRHEMEDPLFVCHDLEVAP
jgi:hypothetical protein